VQFGINLPNVLAAFRSMKITPITVPENVFVNTLLEIARFYRDHYDAEISNIFKDLEEVAFG